MKKFLAGFIFLSLFCLAGCSAETSNNTPKTNGETSSSEEKVDEKIESIDISLQDGSSTIYATETKKINVTISPASNLKVTWVFIDGDNYASISNNEIYVKSSASDNSKIIFYAKIGNVESKKITLTVTNLDEQINAKKAEKNNYVTLKAQASSQYNTYMNSYYDLERYCIQRGWIINGRDFDPTRRSEWSSTKSQMDSYYRAAQSADSEAWQYELKIRELQSQIDGLEKIKAELNK